MTEPVAYLQLDIHGKEMVHIEKDMNGYETKPLYTAEQLHPRVKMTRKQRDRLMWDKENTDLSTCLEYFIKNDGNNDFGLPSENLLGNLTQEDIAQAWLNPEETIEIVPTMKWFVRSKKRDDEGDFEFISGIETPDAWGYSKHHNGVNDPRACAYAFDTKEEAELWKNPLTEAVQLPVEEK